MRILTGFHSILTREAPPNSMLQRTRTRTFIVRESYTFLGVRVRAGELGSVGRLRTAQMCPLKERNHMAAKLVFGMNQSLDGYVDHMAFAPRPSLFRHFIEEAQGQAGSVYGRRTYEVMRYWDDDHPEWGAEEQAFAAAWRNQPKWVVSRSLKSVGPNAKLVAGDLAGVIRELKAERDGEIEVAGPQLAQSLTELGLIDEYRIYLHPVVLGHGKSYFAGPRPPLRLMTNERIGEDVIRLTYASA